MARLSRRHLLQGAAGLGAAGASLVAPRLSRAAVSATDLKFLFVHVYGGWDPTCIFAPSFDNPLVHMDPTAWLSQAGDIPYTDHFLRPSVSALLQTWYERTLFFNGITVPSVGHVECQKLALTGNSTGNSPDWGTCVAAAAADRFPLPHVVVTGPQYNGTYGSVVVRVGSSGETKALLDGSILSRSELGVSVPSAATEAAVDAFASARASMRRQAAAGAREAALLDTWDKALARAEILESLADAVPWDTDGSFESQLGLATDLLAGDLARVVSIQNNSFGAWDTHTDNDYRQALVLEDMFLGLLALLDTWSRTPGTHGGALSDEIVLVLLSEMGRTPALNGGEGKDHWGTTSAMLVGPGFTGNRVIGGYDDYFYGKAMDFATGELDPAGRRPAGGELGATLLAIAGADPEDYVPGHPAVTGILP